MTIDFTQYKALTFDIYATLIDEETGMWNCFPSAIRDCQNRADALRTFSDCEHAICAEQPELEYSKVLTQAIQRFATNAGIKVTQSEADVFGHSVGKYPAFNDTVAAMQELGRHYKLVVLSNIERKLFQDTLDGPLAGVHFDAIYTAQDIGSYKPELRNFTYLIDHVKSDLGVDKGQILHVAQSLTADHVPAKKIGLAPGVWIARKDGKGGKSAMVGDVDALKGQIELGATFESLGEMAEEVEKAFA